MLGPIVQLAFAAAVVHCLAAPAFFHMSAARLAAVAAKDTHTVGVDATPLGKLVGKLTEAGIATEFPANGIGRHND